MRNTIILTCKSLFGSFLVYITILYLTRPNVVKTIDDENTMKIRWSVLLSLSLALASVTSICIFFYLISGRNISGTIYMGDKIKFVPQEV